MKKLTYEINASQTIVTIKFHSIPSKGWWRQEVQPALDFMKALVPATLRSYDPSTFLWEVAFEYWDACKTAFEIAFKFTCIEGSIKTATGAHDPFKGVNVPKDYAEQFHYNAAPVRTTETAESIASKLSIYLGVTIKAQELSELKKLYRAKARELHPDLNPEPEAAQKMSELNRLWSLYTAGGIN